MEAPQLRQPEAKWYQDCVDRKGGQPGHFRPDTEWADGPPHASGETSPSFQLLSCIFCEEQ
jgi:hypothetical protein